MMLLSYLEGESVCYINYMSLRRKINIKKSKAQPASAQQQPETAAAKLKQKERHTHSTHNVHYIREEKKLDIYCLMGGRGQVTRVAGAHTFPICVCAPAALLPPLCRALSLSQLSELFSSFFLPSIPTWRNNEKLLLSLSLFLMFLEHFSIIMSVLLPNRGGGKGAFVKVDIDLLMASSFRTTGKKYFFIRKATRQIL